LWCAPTVPTQETSACRLQLIDARCGIRRVHRLRHPISGWAQARSIFSSAAGPGSSTTLRCRRPHAARRAL
jgi:hypothetical protein